jgi:hypothetical protein
MIAENRIATRLTGELPMKKTTGNFSFADVMRELRSLAENGPSEWDVHAGGGKRYRLLAANTPELRERAFRLGARIYKQMGYIPAAGPELLYSHFDARPDTFILLVADEQNRDAATVTLVFDSEEDGLPLDDIYQTEADHLRAKGRRLMEMVRLVVDDSLRSSREVLVHLFNFCSIYTQHVMGYTDCLITVNPHHAAFYRKLLGFEIVGKERACPKVQNAPAVLLGVSKEYVQKRVRESGGRLRRNAEDRSLYPHFYAQEAEQFIAAFLKHRHQPMTQAETVRYGLNVAKKERSGAY